MAINYYDQAIKIDPNYADAWINKRTTLFSALICANTSDNRAKPITVTIEVAHTTAKLEEKVLITRFIIGIIRFITVYKCVQILNNC